MGRHRSPPCCDACLRRPPLDDDDITDTQIVATAPRVVAPENVVFVAVFTKDRTLIRKAEMRADGSPLWLMGPSGLLNAKELTKNLGALRLDRSGESAVVSMVEVPAGGFRNVDTGEVYDAGTRLRNNLRFVWVGDVDERYFEVVFK